MVVRRKRLVIAVALVAFVSSAPAWAQGQGGKISGVVRDTTGATIPGVTVTATNQATSASETATTGNDGSYSLSVAPGAYNVTMLLITTASPGTSTQSNRTSA